jgi:hypothetical protein
VRKLTLLLFLLAAGAGPPPAPSSHPATLPLRIEDMESLADGTVRYIAPPAWKLASRTDLSAVYESNDGLAQIAITVTPQNTALHDSAKEQMSIIIARGIRDGATKNGQQLVLPPRVEPDDRFFLKMHDAMTGGERTADRIQMYRILGLNLVHVAATAQVENMEESADVHQLAEHTLETMRLSRGAKRIVYGKAQLRAIVPLDWKDTKTDNANGLVATYTDAKDPSRQIILSARIIPKAAQTDVAKRQALLDKMIDQERNAIKPSREEEISGTKYLRQIRYTHSDASVTERSDVRYLIVGDMLVSVRSVAKAPDADAVSAIADKFADDLKPVNEPKSK